MSAVANGNGIASVPGNGSYPATVLPDTSRSRELEVSDAAESFAPCTVYAWCQVDHSRDDDEFEAQYHKQSRSGGVIDYDLVVAEGRPYTYWSDRFDVTVDVENDIYFDQLIVDLIDMKTAWIEFERRLRARSVPGNGTSSDHVSEVTKMVRRRPEVDERLRELDA